MDMNLAKYVAFLTTVEKKSFTAASETLHYSESGISRMIKDLEEEWQITLLRRDRGGVSLTSEGEKLLPQIQSLCLQYQTLAREAEDLKGLRSGLLRIATISSIATYRLPTVIQSFQGKYPAIEYELLLGDYDEITAWVESGRADFGFLCRPVSPDLAFIPYEKDELVAVLPENHPLAKRKKFPLSALEKSPFMLLEKGAQSEVRDLLERNHLHPDIRFTTFDDYAILAMVEKGLGISILPRLILTRIPFRVAIRSLSVPAYRELGIAVKDQESLSLAAKEFLRFLTPEK
jgi:DNA-binding transcriptional LysR family regulator